MIRHLTLLILSIFLVSTLSGCLVIDGHHHGHLPPGQAKKMNH